MLPENHGILGQSGKNYIRNGKKIRGIKCQSSTNIWENSNILVISILFLG